MRDRAPALDDRSTPGLTLSLYREKSIPDQRMHGDVRHSEHYRQCTQIDVKETTRIHTVQALQCSSILRVSRERKILKKTFQFERL